jgi:hypothetical protein
MTAQRYIKMGLQRRHMVSRRQKVTRRELKELTRNLAELSREGSGKPRHSCGGSQRRSADAPGGQWAKRARRKPRPDTPTRTCGLRW